MAPSRPLRIGAGATGRTSDSFLYSYTHYYQVLMGFFSGEGTGGGGEDRNDFSLFVEVRNDFLVDSFRGVLCFVFVL